MTRIKTKNEAITYAVRRKKEGASCRQISTELADVGYTARTGNRLQDNAIMKLVRSAPAPVATTTQAFFNKDQEKLSLAAYILSSKLEHKMQLLRAVVND